MGTEKCHKILTFLMTRRQAQICKNISNYEYSQRARKLFILIENILEKTVIKKYFHQVNDFSCKEAYPRDFKRKEEEKEDAPKNQDSLYEMTPNLSLENKVQKRDL